MTNGAAAARWLIAAVAIAAAGSVAGGTLLPVWTYVGALVPALVGVALLTSYANQLTLGQGGLVGVGAYATANFAGRWDWSPLLAIAGAVVVTVVVAALASPVLRLTGLTFGLATLAVGQIIVELAQIWTPLTGGPSGFTNTGHRVPNFVLGLFVADTGRERFFLAWAIGLLALGLGRNLVRSRFGGSLTAIAADEDVASSFGVPVLATKVRLWLLAAALAAVSGGLLVLNSRFASPEQYALDLSVLLVVGAVVGGARSLVAAVVATVVLESASEVVPGLSGLTLIVSGVLLVVVLLSAPEGLAGLGRQLRGRIGETRDASTSPAPPSDQPATATRDRPTAPAVDDTEPVLAAVDISVRFGGLHAVANASIDVRRGEIVGLIGPNGAGKSTLVNAITGFVPAETGTVVVGGDDVSRHGSHRRVGHGVRRTFQSARLIEAATIEGNVALGAYSLGCSGLFGGLLRLPATRREERQVAAATSAALRAVGLDGLRSASSGGLPAGLRRLVDVARASVSRPNVLLLDEPAAGLNDAETRRLEQVIRDFAAAGVAVVLIEHDLGLVMRTCDRLVVLADGEVIATGTPDAVREDDRVREAYLGVLVDAVG